MEALLCHCSGLPSLSPTQPSRKPAGSSVFREAPAKASPGLECVYILLHHGSQNWRFNLHPRSTVRTPVVSPIHTHFHQVYAGQNGAITLAFSGSGALLAAACCDDPLPGRFPIRLIDSETGRCRLELKGHASMVYSLVWSSGDSLLLSASADGTAKVPDGRRENRAIFHGYSSWAHNTYVGILMVPINHARGTTVAIVSRPVGTGVFSTFSPSMEYLLSATSCSFGNSWCNHRHRERRSVRSDSSVTAAQAQPNLTSI